ncbi:MAG: hypothetical protein LBM02_08430, partial [Lachnospiraceae bacterium]|nr:hypothetical protein [Lachnospiraceae bacterium]
MALNLIIGPSGSGKTTKGYEIIINSSLENEKRNHFILVPEQFTMSTQKKIVDMHPRHGILNIDVLSFLRLSHRIFSETGDIDLPSLSEEGKNLIIRKVVGKISGKLNIYGKAVNQPGTISEIKSAISELLQYKISEEDLENAISSMSSTSRMYLKYKDILQIYIEYNQFIEGRYITSEGILDNLEQVVDRSSILQDSVVFLDSYTGFTPIQQRIICKLLKICKDVYVSVTLGTGENEYAPRTAFEVFALPKRTISNLQEIAIKNGVEINKIYPLKDKIEKKDLNSNKSQLSNDIDLDIDKNIILDKGNNIIPIRFESNLIFSHLEKNIFRLGVKEQIEDNDNRIVIHRSENPKEEALEVAASIRHAVRTRNLKYKDVGLVVAEMDAYGEYLEEAFKIYNIPVFMDYKRSVFLNVGVEFIRSLLNMLVENYSWESIFRFLRVTDIIPRNIVYQLENYCETVGINTYKKWLSPFKYKTKYMTDEDLDTLNKYRNLFVEYISDIDYIKKARSKTVSDIVNALYSFILKEDLQQKLQDLADKYEKEKNLRASKEYNQIYKMIMDLFDQMVGLIGDERIGISEFAKVFDAGLNSLKIGIVPPTTDQVVVGDLTRTRLDDIKALFIIGANDIYIPKIGGEGIISEKDKAFFKKANIELSESKGEKSFEEKFYLYLNLTKPKETIYISYSRRDNLGVSLFPSYLVPSILELYKDKKIIEKTAEEIEPVSQVVLSTYLKELRNALDKNEEFSPKIKMYSKILVDVGDIINKSLENHRISDLTSSVAK